MRRGFPRPRLHVGDLTSFWLDNDDVSNDKWKNREYPVPYSARENAISQINGNRVMECARDKMCIVCGEHVEGDVVWVYLSRGMLLSDSGPFHTKCKDLTIALCPKVNKSVEADDDGFVFVEREWSKAGPIIISRAEDGWKQISDEEKASEDYNPNEL